jgi:methionyl-tRNA formyltransferase
MTVMYMNEGLDTGDILLQHKLKIRRRETTGTLHDRLAAQAPGALSEALLLLKQGRAPRIPQNNEAATYAPKLSRDNGEIVWTATRDEIDRKIRAMNPWPAAHTFLPTADGPRKLKVFSCIQTRLSSGRPGEVMRADKNGLLVATGAGGVLLREIQLEGKKRMQAKEFLLGTPVLPGTVLAAPLALSAA